MSLILEGLTFGLLLAVSLGPIFIALTQTSIEKGLLPGFTVGFGIWVSDFLIVILLYKFVDSIKSTIEHPTFNFWMGLSGALILVLFGLILMIKKTELNFKNIKYKRSDYIGFWLKGFLINTINPFTFVFWMGVISTYVIGRGTDIHDMSILLSTILTVIILSDTLKVYMANFLKKWLTPKHINLISKFSGLLLIGFGVFLAFRVI